MDRLGAICLNPKFVSIHEEVVGEQSEWLNYASIPESSDGVPLRGDRDVHDGACGRA